MTTMIETIYEKGVFRPLKPVAIAENQRVKIRLEDADLLPTQPLRAYGPLPVGEYILDDLGEDFAFDTVPLPEIGKLQVRVVHVGELLPAPYPED